MLYNVPLFSVKLAFCIDPILNGLFYGCSMNGGGITPRGLPFDKETLVT